MKRLLGILSAIFRVVIVIVAVGYMVIFAAGSYHWHYNEKARETPTGISAAQLADNWGDPNWSSTEPKRVLYGYQKGFCEYVFEFDRKTDSLSMIYFE